MARKKNAQGDELTELRPMLTPEADEARMVSLAIRQAEKQLRDGTASPAVIVHYLRLGSSSEKRRMEKLEEENKKLKAQTKALESGTHTEELLQKAITAFTDYRGGSQEDEYDEDY